MGFKKEFGRSPGKTFSPRSRLGKPAFGKRDSPRSVETGRGGFELFDAVCEKCGKDTQVPFRPTGNKPVYCRECFKGGDAPQRAKPEYGARDDSLAEINRKLDKIMAALKIR
jgi:CxxC-x17-CxxC domain-containing protein